MRVALRRRPIGAHRSQARNNTASPPFKMSQIEPSASAAADRQRAPCALPCLAAAALQSSGRTAGTGGPVLAAVGTALPRVPMEVSARRRLESVLGQLAQAHGRATRPLRVGGARPCAAAGPGTTVGAGTKPAGAQRHPQLPAAGARSVSDSLADGVTPPVCPPAPP
eukprot:COSAG04_NODE_6532_length_1309_cov_1.114050_3_plen_166_part_01